MKKGIIYSFIISLVICMIMPFSVFASTSGNQVVFTNNTSYSETLKLFRYEIQAIYPSSGGQYTYAYYFQTDPGLYGVISGRMNDSTSELFTVAVQNGISETFYSNQISAFVYSVQLIEYNQTLPQEVIDYIKNLDENVELTTDMLDTLIKIKSYNIFYESYAVLFDMLETYDPISIDSTGYYSYVNYPLFNIKANDQIYKLYCNNGLIYSFVFYSSTPINSSNISNLHIVKQGGSDSYSLVRRITIVEGNLNTYRIDFSVPSTGNYIISFGFDINYFSPIYCYRRDYEYLSTDFCLLYGFTNQIINDLHIVAQGTQQSQSAAADLEQGTSDLASDISSYNQIESDYNNQMNQALNNIDFSDQFSNNQNFLSGASFVKTVFNSFMQIDILRIFFIVLCIVLIAKRFI